MSLKNYLLNENSFIFGIGGTIDDIKTTNLAYGGPSKSIRYGANTGGRIGEPDIPSYHLYPRISWFGEDSGDNANPTFRFGRDHGNSVLDGGSFRGGMQVYEDRVDLDFKRIKNFLGSEQGNAFKRRQVALQLLNNHANPGQRVFNLGENIKAQILASGLSNIKRAGALPIPGTEEGLGEAKTGLGMLIQADYISYLKKNYSDLGKSKSSYFLREQKYSLGDPGARPSGNSKFLNLLIGNVEDGPEKRRNYGASYDERVNLVDKINVTKVFKATDGIETSFTHKDFIKFKFEVIDSKSPKDTYHIYFRAFLDQFGDQFQATHNEIKYNGRGETFYTYQKFNRTINLAFKIAAQTRYEMKPLYQKLNFLAAQTAPNYSESGRIRTPYMRITVGDYLVRVPGVLNNLNIDWQKDYPWEIVAAPTGLDANMKELPHVLDVNFSFTPIHAFTPNNSINTPFIGIGNLESTKNITEYPVSGSWLGLGETVDKEGNIYKYTNPVFNLSVKERGNDIGEGVFKTTPDNQISLNGGNTSGYSGEFA